MGKRKRKHKDRDHASGRPEGRSAGPGAAEEVEEACISSIGKKTIGGGIVLLILGFVVLTLTDPSGKNWASTLSPLLILGAYGVIAYGIFLPDSAPEAPPASGETKADAGEVK